MPEGRPTKYKPEFVAQAQFLCGKLGATDANLAEFFGVNEDTIYEWKNVHPEFSESIKSAKAQWDDEEVIQSFRKKATGFTVPSEKIFCHEGQIIRAATTTYYPPDTAAGFIWLKNRRPKDWKDKHEVSLDISELAGKSLDELIDIFKTMQGDK